MKNDQPLFLNEEQVRQHLHMAELIPAMEKALIEFSDGKVTQPVRSVINVDPPGGFLGLMPALTLEGLGLKAVTFYPSNVERGIPPTGQEFRRNSRVESYKGTCRTIRERSWRESNVSRRSSARRRCRRNYDKFQNTCAKRIVVEAWLPCERNWRVSPGLARTRR